MADHLDLSGLTLNAREAQSVSEAVFEAAFNDSPISEVHEIREGIDMKTQIPVLGLFGLIGEAHPDCTNPEATNQIPLSEKFWDPKTVGFRLKHCRKRTNDLFKLFKRAKTAAGQWDAIDSEEMAFIEDRAKTAVIEMVQRFADFGDTAADNVSGTGVITDGIDVKYFNVIDGIWKQLFAIATATPAVKVDIAANGSASKALQDSDLTASNCYDVMKDMYNGADSRMLDMPGLMFQMTRSMFNNWVNYLEDKSLGFTTQLAEEGSTRWSFRGIPIVVRSDWDRTIRAYMDNTTTWDLPHRILLTSSSNIPIGLLSEGDLDELSSHYSKDDKANYVDAAVHMDAKVLLDYAVMVGY